jgi:hypothetical protein
MLFELQAHRAQISNILETNVLNNQNWSKMDIRIKNGYSQNLQ